MPVKHLKLDGPLINAVIINGLENIQQPSDSREIRSKIEWLGYPIWYCLYMMKPIMPIVLIPELQASLNGLRAQGY